MKRLAVILLAVLGLACTGYAQTVVTVQNPSFETANPYTDSRACTVGTQQWNSGPIPSWTASGSGAFGSFQPCASIYTSFCDGSTVAYTNGPTLSQDLGVAAVPNATYTLKVCMGHRGDAYNANSGAIALLAGTTSLCSLNVDTSSIPSGTFAMQTLTCTASANPPAGDLIIALSSTATQADFDAVTLSYTTAPPPNTITARFTYDDNTAVAGNALLFQQDSTGANNQIASAILDSTGLATSAIPLDPTQKYMAELMDPTGAVITSAFSVPLPASQSSAMLTFLAQNEIDIVIVKATGAVKSVSVKPLGP